LESLLQLRAKMEPETYKVLLGELERLRRELPIFEHIEGASSTIMFAENGVITITMGERTAVFTLQDEQVSAKLTTGGQSRSYKSQSLEALAKEHTEVAEFAEMVKIETVNGKRQLSARAVGGQTILPQREEPKQQQENPIKTR
jgi:hypothetical protein